MADKDKITNGAKSAGTGARMIILLRLHRPAAMIWRERTRTLTADMITVTEKTGIRMYIHMCMSIHMGMHIRTHRQRQF
jgi:hypothetical protein